MSNQPLRRTVVVSNPQGLHMRPARLLVEQAALFQAKITLWKDEEPADCESFLSLMTLGAECGTELCLTVEGSDAEQAVEAIVKLFDNGFYEPEGAESE